ncbi:DUF2207 domain-containing protein [Notoacmeibacter ruber]|uniref:DUF2207 domain-containing protein n=1 Tax=Notoacmeibacter ruber TaxID=2670375 RepID=A0A3L7JCB5_9HYPH|nr:DUF2207 domain-containing protein [Notoacmeibacter ruber]RLQ87955.1 DUF2207 domain-containing protein [Notoacmeibacter ruber]
MIHPLPLRRSLGGLGFALLLFLHFVPDAFGDERILDYESAIQVAADGRLTVRETITVDAEGDEIRRGIYRDFARYQMSSEGRRQLVAFDILSVTRDGETEDYKLESASGGSRLRIGDPDHFLVPGRHIYQIRYQTDRQVRFFDDHDELLWNVTGTEWAFPIDKARATITLPSGEISNTVVYTGAYGETAQDAVASLMDDSRTASFRTTAPLAAGEGLTVGIAFPKNIVSPPDAYEVGRWFLRDHLGTLILAIGTLLVGAYYFWIWRRVGRDPEKGIMVPRWDPPADLSPALVTYIEERSAQNNRMISAALLSLAIKGLVRLDDVRDDLRIVPTTRLRGQASAALPVGEAVLARSLLPYQEGLTLDKENGQPVREMVKALRRVMVKEHRDTYYRSNAGWTILGIVLSALVLIAAFAAGALPLEILPIGLPLVLGSIIISIFVANSFRSNGAGLPRRIFNVLFAGLFAFGFLSGVVGAAIEILANMTLDWSIVALGALIMVNILFVMIMGAPTPLGRKKMDEIEGLRTYIELAEADRMNLRGAPAMSPSHYESLLPYAVALDLEKPWNTTFRSWLAASAAAGGAYVSHWAPGWYDGPGERIGWTDSMADIGDRMGGAVTSAMPTPSSSSSGFSSGGGFSGGGGGGGGGGGW